MKRDTCLKKTQKKVHITYSNKIRELKAEEISKNSKYSRKWLSMAADSMGNSFSQQSEICHTGLNLRDKKLASLLKLLHLLRLLTNLEIH
jgi:hypothetical protein